MKGFAEPWCDFVLPYSPTGYFDRAITLSPSVLICLSNKVSISPSGLLTQNQCQKHFPLSRKNTSFNNSAVRRKWQLWWSIQWWIQFFIFFGQFKVVGYKWLLQLWLPNNHPANPRVVLNDAETLLFEQKKLLSFALHMWVFVTHLFRTKSVWYNH